MNITLTDPSNSIIKVEEADPNAAPKDVCCKQDIINMMNEITKMNIVQVEFYHGISEQLRTIHEQLIEAIEMKKAKNDSRGTKVRKNAKAAKQNPDFGTKAEKFARKKYNNVMMKPYVTKYGRETKVFKTN